MKKKTPKVKKPQVIEIHIYVHQNPYYPLTPAPAGPKYNYPQNPIIFPNTTC